MRQTGRIHPPMVLRLMGKIDSNSVNGAIDAKNVKIQYVDIGVQAEKICTANTPQEGLYVVYTGQTVWIV